MVAPCSGLRVLDLSSGPAGGVATMVLADYGAEVLKLERPEGDPFAGLAAAPVWLRGKQRAVVDLKTPGGVAQLHNLVPSADIVVSTFRPGVAERLRADYATLSALNHRLIYCSITGWGPHGPYRDYKGYEGLVAAKSGRMLAFAGQGTREGPVYAAVQVATHAAAQAAVHGILAALLAREQTGRGQLVETSLLQGMLPYDLGGLFTRQLTRKLPLQYPEVAPGANRQPTLQYQPVLTRDGHWIQLGNLIEHLFHAFIGAVELAEIYLEPEFQNAPYLGDEAREALRLRILARMRERTLVDWMVRFIANGNVAAEPIVSTQAALDHPQVVAGDHVVEGSHPRLGQMRQIGVVAALSETPGAVAAPDRIGGGIPAFEGVSRTVTPSAMARAVRHPLEGISVVEFASIIATPLGCSYLADLGARVIKVEPPEGDGYRRLGVGAAKTTAGKESISLDLKTDEGQRIARQLVERADMLVHNYRPGVPERLGIGYEQVRGYNPRIVYVSATGYGEEGPYAHRPAAHPVAGAAAGGVLWQAGAGMPPERAGDLELEHVREYARRFSRANEVNPDPNTSMLVVTAALLGLLARQREGIGQHVQTNMLIANAYANLDDFVLYDGKPERPLVDRDLYGLHALYRLYQAADGWVFLACPAEAEWRGLCQILNRAELLGDARFATPESRRANDVELTATLSEIFRCRTADAWEALLTAHDCGCVRADATLPGAFWDTDEHALVNGFVCEAEHLRWGAYWRHGPTVTLSDTPGRYGAGVLAGQHTRQLLRELGHTSDAIAAHYAAGIVATEEP